MQILPLTKSQQRVWLEWKLSPESAAYNNPLLYRLMGDVNIDCLGKALQHIVNEQPALRTYFPEQGGLPKQILASTCQMILDYHDVSSYAKDEIDSITQAIVAKNVQRAFQLDQLPLFRFSLIKQDYNHFIFVLNIHHIVVDGYSAQILLNDISRYYSHFSSIDKIPGDNLALKKHDETYKSYVTNSLESNIDDSEESHFWQQQFKEANIQVDLYQADIATVLDEDTGVRSHFSISPLLTKQIKTRAKEYRTTDFTLLMAVFYWVLAKYSNQRDLTLGYPVDIRPVNCRELLGFFVNTIPMRMVIEQDDTLHTFVQGMNQKRKEIKSHQKTDLGDIIRYVRKIYPSQPNSLYNASFVRANFALSGLDLPGILVTPCPVTTNAVKDDLCLLYDETEAFEFELEYRVKRFPPEYIKQIENSYVQCLHAIVEHESTFAAIRIFNEIPAPLRGVSTNISASLISKLKQHADEAPYKIAVLTSQSEITYKELYDQVIAYSEILSGEIDRLHPVIVCLERTPNLLIVLLSLQWLEMTYIPIDSSITLDRLSSIIEDSNAGAIIFDERYSHLTNNLAIKKIPIYSLSFSAVTSDRSLPTNNHASYIIYTSGSTGKPKGVEVSQSALNNFLASMACYFMHGDNALLLAITTIAFDIAGLELFLPIWQQRTVFITTQDQHKDPFAIAAILEHYPVTHLQATPAMWQILNAIGWKGKENLVALCGGEALTPSLKYSLLPKVAELWNMYGPTEATIWCSLKRIKDNDEISVGKPIANMEMCVMDEYFQILPPYVKGDLYIGGLGLANGYINRPELNTLQFISHSNTLTGRLYRVGDIACTNSNGEFIIYGRCDNQIKLNGYRIELGEIESQIQALKGIRQSAAIVYQQQLIAYVCLDENTDQTPSTIISSLATYLPEYMLPKQCIIINEMPLTISGKIDRKSLPLPESNSHSIYEAPADEVESTLQTIWQSILNKDLLGVTDHFYSAGGHSLLAAQLTSKINIQFNTDFNIADILNHPTIRSQKHLLQSINDKDTSKIFVRVINDEAPLTWSQKSIWFASQLSHHTAQYHMAAQIKVKGVLDLARLQQTIDQLIERHESLRTIIYLKNQEPYQKIIDKPDIDIESLMDNKDTTLIDWVSRPFDNLDTLLWRIAVHTVNQSEHTIILCLHHLIADGYSVPLILNDIASLYETDLIKDLLPYRYIDYAHRENNQAESNSDISFWRNELLACPYLTLPHDSINQNDVVSPGAQHITFSTTEMVQAVRQYCEISQISISSFFISIFSLLMQRYSGQRDFCMGVPFSNRHLSEVQDIVGCFINIIPFRVAIPNDYTFAEWNNVIDKQLIRYISHASLPFASLLNHLQIERNMDQSPLFPAILNIQPDPFTTRYFNNLDVSVSPIYTNTTKYDLSLDIHFTESQFTFTWEYANKLFNAETISKMNVEFHTLIYHCIHDKDKLINLSGRTIPKKSNLLAPKINNYRAPQTDFQKHMAVIWKRILKLDKIGLDDQFFTLGGHSFLAAKMIAIISEELNKVVPLEMVFHQSKFEDFCLSVQSYSPTQNIVNAVERPDSVPLTFNQQQMALIYKNKPDGTYHVGVLIQCPFKINQNQMESAFNEVISSHSIYGCYLLNNTKEANLSSQIIVKLDTVQLDDNQNVIEHAEQLNKILFDLKSPPLLRTTILKNSQDYLLVTLHHLIGDEWSLQQLVQSVFDRYQKTKSALLNPPEWFSWVNQWLSPNQKSIDYWQDYLKNSTQTFIQKTSLNDNDNQDIERQRLIIPADIVNHCKQIAMQYDASLYHVLLTAFIYYLHQLTQEDNISFATVNDRRQTTVRQNLHGYLVNLLPISVDSTSIKHFADLLTWVKNNAIDSIGHADVDFAYLLEKNFITNPHIIFNYQHAHGVINNDQSLVWHEVLSQHAKFDMTFQLRNCEDGTLDLMLESRKGYYHTSFIKHLLDCYSSILELLPKQYLDPLSTWSYTDNHFSDSAQDYQGNLSQTLINQSELSNTAIIYNNQTISYQTLWNDVDCLATGIIQKYGQRECANNIIAVCVSNRYHYIVSILAILRLGAAFLPIDPTYPTERQHYLIENSKALFTIYDATLPLLGFEPGEMKVSSHTDKLFSNHIDDSNTAYVIYTSGTTGLPKGVVIQRKALKSFILALQEKLKINSFERILQFSSVSFDASIWEIFLSIVSGATLIIPNDKERKVGRSLQDFIQTHKITHAILTPSVLGTLSPEKLTSLRVIASGGEACTRYLVENWTKHCEFYNAYGPTEATVCVALGKFSLDRTANYIGESLGNAQLWVASPELKPLTIGMIGELIIGGEILAEGYFNELELTQKHFVTLDNKRWYRTGDYVRLVDKDSFEFVSRQDRQIKLRGLRIELGEIESALKSISAICSVTCIVENDQLIAYFTANSILSIADILDTLTKQLPAHLLPAQLIQIDDIALLPSGKIDFTKLPKTTVTKQSFYPPTTLIENKLHTMWCHYLNLNSIDIKMDFLMAGGNSLQSMQIAADIEKTFSIEFPVELFYEHNTIAAQAKFIEESTKSSSTQSIELLINTLSEDERRSLLESMKSN